MREGGERFIELYLVFADRENAGPGTLRLADIIREHTAGACDREQEGSKRPPSSGVGARNAVTKRRAR
jgi:hypothetical protein